MIVGDRLIGPDAPPYVIAEIGVNHDGDEARAAALVDAARQAGADAVKLQYFEAARLVGASAGLAGYQRRRGATDARAMLAALELPPAAIERLALRARSIGAHAIASVFSVEHAAVAGALPLDALKVASPDVVNRPLLEALAATGRPLLVSTGAATVDEVRAAAQWLAGVPHVFLHCVSAYPTPEDEARLAGRAALAAHVPAAVGYSDHTTAVDTGALAVASGACVLEKHLTYDRAAAGPDHAASLDPAQLAEYVRFAHRAWRMMGPARKEVVPIEEDVRRVARQSITALRDLPAGHRIARSDLTVKRPGSGIEPARMSEVVGRRLARAVAADRPLTEDDLAAVAAPQPA
jgi:N-acetylneuraminate synthase/N,N'-diacetyllegionaminate synthase